MANSRVARFITEAAPPQFVSVMRYRATKMLDTINEEERGCSANDSLALAPKSTSSSLSLATSSSNATNSKYLLKEFQITLSAFSQNVTFDESSILLKTENLINTRKDHGVKEKVKLDV
ncbi:hypothetical protein RJ639_006025 [Escallonia herrerae]|uniref:Uncharacterized protein n=1 Tax=Escallonia herrerae TaxID=1293975 RepID=A0AA88VY16_9ASTE|nr:hypothetical protein RJ639_006025 [Escallonia herrerae]